MRHRHGTRVHSHVFKSRSVASCLAEGEVRVLGNIKMVAQNTPARCHRKRAMKFFDAGLERSSPKVPY